MSGDLSMRINADIQSQVSMRQVLRIGKNMTTVMTVMMMMVVLMMKVMIVMLLVMIEVVMMMLIIINTCMLTYVYHQSTYLSSKAICTIHYNYIFNSNTSLAVNRYIIRCLNTCYQIIITFPTYMPSMSCKE